MAFRKPGQKQVNEDVFPTRMRRAFGQCISQIHAVPVQGSPTDSFVLEVDITPDSDICEEMEFAYMEGGKVRKMFRQQASNIDRSKAGGGAVKNAHAWRTKEELRSKKDELQEEVEHLEKLGNGWARLIDFIKWKKKEVVLYVHWRQ